jgi:hypothetical protein
MKKQAIILFFPLTVFLTETVSFLPCWDDSCLPGINGTAECVKPEKPGSCTVTKELEACSAKEEIECAQAPESGKCNKQTDADNPEEDCTSNPDCSTCPVCYTFTIQPQYELNSTGFDLSRQYHLRDIEIISSYETDVWKPPNDSDCSY